MDQWLLQCLFTNNGVLGLQLYEVSGYDGCMPEWIHHWFFPHPTNNHRARLLHIDAMAAYVVILAVLSLGFRYIPREYPDILGYATDIRVEQLLTDTNAKRQEQGLAPLSLNPQLSQAAAGKAQDMFAKGYWAHVSPDNKTPWDFITGAGYRYSVAGENLAKNFSTSDAVVNAWMNSPSHRDNVLKPSYTEIGFAVVNGTLAGEETTLVVQMFGAPAGQLAAAAQPQPIVKPVQAAQLQVSPHVPQPTVSPTLMPTPTPTAIPTPVALGVGASVAANLMPIAPPISFPLNFASVHIQPRFDIATVSRGISMAFGGMLLGVMVIDAWFIAKRRIVRVSGHTIAHILFLGALMLLISSILPGSVL